MDVAGYPILDVDFFNKYATNAYYISRGASGNVYGRIPWSDKQLAIKQVMFADGKVTDEFKERIEKRKNIWNSLDHKNLMRIHSVDLSRLPIVMFIVMEYAAGGSLHKTLRSMEPGRKLQLNVVKDWAKQIAEGMLYMHQQKIVHRDLKSSNILLMKPFDGRNPDVTLKIADFDDVKEHDHTTTMSFVGTCAYMAPEVIAKQQFSKASDVYSFGVVLWEMLSGDVPYSGLESTEIIFKAMKGELSKLPLGRSFPEDFKLILKRCVRCERSIRPSFAQIQHLFLLEKPKDDFLVKMWAQEGQKKKIKSINELPLELLDVILMKSYRYYVSSIRQKVEGKDEFIFKHMASVDFCWSQRLRKKRFRRRIWRHMSEFYTLLYKKVAIHRNNNSYMKETILPNDDLIEHLRSTHCLSDVKARLMRRVLQGKKPFVDKSELLHAVRLFDDAQLSTFVHCLRRSDQRRLTGIEENGGVVVKTSIQAEDGVLLDATFNGLRDKNRPRSYQTDKVINQLKVADIEILGSVQDRQIVAWIWCKSEKGLSELQNLNESNELINVITCLSPAQRKSASVSICRDQFNKKVAVRKLAIKLTTSLRVNAPVRGVTKLRNEIYVLCRSNDWSPTVIKVYEDQNPCRFKRKFQIKECRLSCDIVSNEKENCLFISDMGTKCIWKIKFTPGTNGHYEANPWLTSNYYMPYTMSASRDGEMMIIERSDAAVLLIYDGSNAELLRIIQMPDVIKCPHHAVETYAGDFIILSEPNAEENEDLSPNKDGNSTWGIYQVTSDGQIVISSSAITSETQEVKDPWHLSLCIDDRVLVASSKVILLDSDFASHTIVDDKIKISGSGRLFYDEEKKQLIVGGIGRGVDIYNFTLI